METARHRTALLGLALGALLVTTPAAAQSQAISGAAALSFSKSTAILGGSSRLEALLASQGAGPAPTYAAAAPAFAAPVVRAIAPLVPPSGVGEAGAVPADRPDIFNSVSLPVSRSPLDARWHAVRYGSPGARAAAYAASLTGADELDRLDAVNRFVNARVRFVDDRQQFGIDDRWTNGADTLARGRGDCEDYAIAKMQMLRHAGFADRDLYLAVVRDLVRRADHAVLVVRSGGRFWVLDNGTDRVLDDRAIADYRPVLTFSGGKVFTHGYRRQSAPLPPVTIASADGRAAPVAPAALLPAAAPTDQLPEVAMTPVLAGLMVPSLDLGSL